MSPIYQYRCDDCGCEQEVFYKIAEKPQMLACNVCTGTCFQVPALGHGGIRSSEAAWLKDVCEVVNKDGGPHCQAFLETPSRENYKTWMEKEGIRPIDPGEKTERKKTDKKALTEATMKRWQESKKITV